MTNLKRKRLSGSWLVGGLALVGMLGCSHISSSSTGADVSYGADAEQNYNSGMKELDAHNYPEAVKYLEYVSARFPYSKFAPLAELAVADADFQQEKYVEATDRYRNFIKLHPTHPKVDYAAFRVGMCYVNQIPSDFFFLPSSSEKDQSDVRNALNTFLEFINSYPHSEHIPEAQEQIAAMKKRLAQHEMRIAQFYMDHEHPMAAAGRFETVVRDYAGSGFDAEAMIKLGRIYIQEKEPDKAHAVLQKLIKDYPADKHVAEAMKLLGNG